MESGNWKEIREKLLSDPQVAAGYEALRPRYEIISKVIGERISQGLSHADIAKLMGIKQTKIARFESGEGNLTLEFVESMLRCLNMELCVRKKGDTEQTQK